MTVQRVARVLIAGVILTGLFATPTFAAEGESIALTPTSKRLSLDPGTVKEDKISIINDGTVPYAFRVYARPYLTEGEEYKPVFDKLTAITDVYEWISFKQTDYKLAPGETVEVPFTIRVPATAQGGGHYGVIFAETQPPTPNETSVIRKKRVGSILYTTISGDNRSDGSIVEKSVPFLQTNPPLKASTRIANSGNVDFQTRNAISVKTVFGTTVYTTERELTVLPSTTRKVSYEWSGGSTFGLYQVTVSTSYLGKTETSSNYVLLMPIWVMIALLAIIIAGSGLITGLKITKAKKTRRVRKTKSSRRRR